MKVKENTANLVLHHQKYIFKKITPFKRLISKVTNAAMQNKGGGNERKLLNYWFLVFLFVYFTCSPLTYISSNNTICTRALQKQKLLSEDNGRMELIIFSYE